jgi:hypothetical protein
VGGLNGGETTSDDSTPDTEAIEMGTNFYAKHPGMEGEGLHIGKRSAGWEFLWRAHPELGLMSTVGWHRFLDHPWVTIVAEYGVEVALDEFWVMATNQCTAAGPTRRRPDDDDGPWAGKQWRDRNGFPFANYEFC